MDETFRDHDINVSGTGERDTKCPKCSHTRKPGHKNQKCLSVNTDKGVWLCHNCGWEGALKKEDWEYKRVRAIEPRNFKLCEYKPASIEDGYREGMVKHFAERGISEAVLLKRGIEVRKVFMPQTGKEEWAIAFPFMRNGQIANVKYRTTKEKHFRLETGCEPVFYGLDGVDPLKPLIICEGEYDQLSFETAGIENSISVPNGAGSDLTTCLGSAADLLEPIKKIILAGDNDEMGVNLMLKLGLRFGQEKCYRVDWPVGCKDANDVLVKFGAEELRYCIENARPLPIAGVFEISDLCDSVIELFTKGPDRGLDPGWDNVAKLYRPRAGEVSIITGVPGSGKSSFMSALAVNMAMQHQWQFVSFSPENSPPQRYLSFLLELYTGKPFGTGPTPRMTVEEMTAAINWAHKYFIFLEPQENRTVDGLLELTRKLIFRRGINALILDPWSYIEHNFQNETAYIGEQLKKIKHFAWVNQIHIFIVAHPFKMRRERNGSFPVPTLYDISGSANWYNMADNGICIHRDKTDSSQPVQIHVQKIRFRDVGELGQAELYFDKVTGRYSESPQFWQVKAVQPSAEIDLGRTWWNERDSS